MYLPLILHGLAFLSATPAAADQIAFEAGALVEGNLPGGSYREEFFLNLGISARVSYEVADWGLGVITRGSIATQTPFSLSANGKTLSGQLTQRQGIFGPVIRRFFDTSDKQKRWYLEAGFMAAQTDILNPEAVYPLPAGATDEGLFMNGYAICIGGGLRLERRWFAQLNYFYKHFGLLQIVGRINEKKQVLYEYPIRGEYHAVALSFSFGLFEVSP